MAGDLFRAFRVFRGQTDFNQKLQTFFTTEDAEGTEEEWREKGMGWLAGFTLLSVELTSLWREFTAQSKSC